MSEMEITKQNYVALGIVATLAGGYLTVGVLFSLAHTWPFLIVSVPILTVGLFLIRKVIKKENHAEKSE
jgi:FtsH-binding integral membrane protein